MAIASPHGGSAGGSPRGGDFQPGGVLLVEDDDAITEELSEVFRDEGFRVATAQNGRKALDVLSHWRPSVVLLDLMMPVMSGWQLMDVMKADAQLSSIPVVVITAGQNAYRSAAVGPVFIKPLDMDSLLRAVRTYANGS